LAGRIWFVNGAAFLAFAAAVWFGNLWVGLGVLAAALAATFWLTRSLGAPLQKLLDALIDRGKRKRDLEYDSMEDWKALGPLGFHAADNLIFSMQRREYYRGAVMAVGSPFFICDDKGVITHCSKTLLAMLKKTDKDVVGKSVSQALHNKDGVSLTERIMREKGTENAEHAIEIWDGRVIDVFVYIDCVRSLKDEVIGAVTCLVDLSVVKEQQKKLQEQQQSMLRLGEQISDLAQRMASATEELSASADEQARGAQQQKGQTDTVATAMEEMTATVLEVAQNASQTSEAATAANKSANEGVNLVRKAVSGINDVADSTHKLSQVLAQLDAQTGEIGRIINVINDIADQTNLLALNAAIEAARAGDAGRGFAVVADEVRKLAEKTMTATKEVENAIREIQERSRHAISSMKETEQQVGTSTELSNQAGQSLEEILQRIEDMTGRVAQIATAAEEQSSAAEEINKSIEDIANIAREADEGAGQAASATRELAELSQRLYTLSLSFAQRQADASKLRASSSEMKGILPKLMCDFVREKYGDELARGLQEELGGVSFLPTVSYPDQVLHQIAEYVQAKTGKPAREVFVELGKFTIQQFHKTYRRYFKSTDFKEFLMTMNSTHAQLTKDFPGITPPKFEYDDQGKTLVMTYISKRNYPHYFEGILRGSAEFFKVRPKIEVTVLDEHTARAEITF
jgi:methyl-accepting chemotaxis protein